MAITCSVKHFVQQLHIQSIVKFCHNFKSVSMSLQEGMKIYRKYEQKSQATPP